MRMAIAWPERWNGAFIAVGNGGAGGRIEEKTILQYAGQGYVAASTDMGTAPNPLLKGIDNPEVWKDYGYRATYLMTEVAKEEIKKRFRSKPEVSVFNGISTGGQQALAMAQRYPDSYDEIIAGVPAHSRTRLHSYFLWNYRHSYEEGGRRLFTKTQEENYRQAALEYFAERETFPRAKGRFISNPEWTEADMEAVIWLAVKKDDTFTSRHTEMLRMLQLGPVHAETGEKLYDGIPPAAAIYMSKQNLFLFNWIFGKDINYFDINFGDDIDKYFALLREYLDADSPDLDAFKARGGKLILYSGTQDASVPYHATLKYYRALIKRYGTPEEVQSFCRYYLLPGRNHLGGPGVQELYKPLEAIRAWREKGKVPEMYGISCTEHYKVLIRNLFNP